MNYVLCIPAHAESEEWSIRAKGNVWIHSEPNYNVESRVGISYEGDKMKMIGETQEMYEVESAYVSKLYTEKVK
ncbi:hypothetical protein LCL95_01270 [Bacillus timonensis]|nr:hypothetical protein [Bacillus timonensis]